MLYGKSHESANTLIRKMMSLGMVRKTAHGQYCKGGVCAGRRGFAVSAVDAIA